VIHARQRVGTPAPRTRARPGFRQAPFVRRVETIEATPAALAPQSNVSATTLRAVGSRFHSLPTSDGGIAAEALPVAKARATSPASAPPLTM
jgi:hypothetical protein